MSSIEANVGAMLAFRTGDTDAKKLSNLLYPRKPSAAEKLILELEDYSCVVRKSPVGGSPVEPPFKLTMPKVREPVHEFPRILSFMKNEMEKRYGGFVGARKRVFAESPD